MIITKETLIEMVKEAYLEGHEDGRIDNCTHCLSIQESSEYFDWENSRSKKIVGKHVDGTQKCPTCSFNWSEDGTKGMPCRKPCGIDYRYCEWSPMTGKQQRRGGKPWQETE